MYPINHTPDFDQYGYSEPTPAILTPPTDVPAVHDHSDDLPGHSAKASNLGDPSKWNWAQRTHGERFSADDEVPAVVRGRTINQVATEIATGELDPDSITVVVVVKGDNVLIVNTRSATALTRAGIPRDRWNVVDGTGDPGTQQRLADQLANNKLTDAGIEATRSTEPAADLENQYTLRLQAGKGGGTVSEEEDELEQAETDDVK